MKILWMLFIYQISLAQVLLLPDSNVDFKTYSAKCSKEGYQCSMHFSLQQIEGALTPQFDEFVNQLDYSSETFKSDFIPTFFKILKDENLSLDQIDMIVKMIDQLKEFSDSQKKKQLSMLGAQLDELVRRIKDDKLSELPESYLVVLKTAVPLDFQKNLKPPFFKIKTTVVKFDRLPVDDAPLVEGTCDSASVHPFLRNKKWQIENGQTCHLSEQFAQVQTSTVDFVKSHQTGLITTGLVVLGAAILMNNYEIKLTF